MEAPWFGLFSFRCTGLDIPVRKVVSFVGGADLHHLGDDAAFCVSASGLLGGGLVRSSLCRRCLGRHPVVVVLEVSVVGDPDGVLYCGKLVAVVAGWRMGCSIGLQVVLLRLVRLEDCVVKLSLIHCVIYSLLVFLLSAILFCGVLIGFFLMILGRSLLCIASCGSSFLVMNIGMGAVLLRWFLCELALLFLLYSVYVGILISAGF